MDVFFDIGQIYEVFLFIARVLIASSFPFRVPAIVPQRILAVQSAANGVTIDVVSVDSDACDLENLGAMADVSGGTVTKVKASELTSNFAGILANPILASQVCGRK